MLCCRSWVWCRAMSHSRVQAPPDAQHLQDCWKSQTLQVARAAFFMQLVQGFRVRCAP